VGEVILSLPELQGASYHQEENLAEANVQGTFTKGALTVPTRERNGKTVFRYSEKGTAWNNGNALGIHHIFPAGAIGLDSDPNLLTTSINTIDEMHRWADYNGFSSWYTACARVGCDPHIILEKLRIECDQHGFPNGILYYGGGGIESCGGFLAVNEMMFQSYDGVMRFFPDWPKDQNARFGTFRAVGAFLVSAEIKNGDITGVKIVSEKAKDCVVLNPWPGQTVHVIRSGRSAESVTGLRFILKTTAGETVELRSQR
jgi:alpha-L-fucosidase 2